VLYDAADTRGIGTSLSAISRHKTILRRVDSRGSSQGSQAAAKAARQAAKAARQAAKAAKKAAKREANAIRRADKAAKNEAVASGIR
jgi:hypothetical protein